MPESGPFKGDIVVGDFSPTDKVGYRLPDQPDDK